MLLALLLAAAHADPQPVTNADYKKCVEASACRPAAFDDPRSAANAKSGKRENASAYSKRSGPAQPAVGVSWNDANAYCKFSGGKLATEAEWLTALGKVKGLSEWVADLFVAGKPQRVLREPKRRTGELPNARAHWITFRCSR